MESKHDTILIIRHCPEVEKMKDRIPSRIIAATIIFDTLLLFVLILFCFGFKIKDIFPFLS